MKLLIAIFGENSEISIMRVMAVLSLIIAGILAFKGQNATVGIFVTAAFSGKVAQKYIEAKN